MQHAIRAVVAQFLASALLAGMAPPSADAMCCACRTCGGTAFCVDGVNNSVLCATLCVTSGCSSTVFDSVDTCAGGCDGAPVAPSATPSNTPSASPTVTPTGSPTPTFALSGQILYYVGSRPVSGADVALTAGTTAIAVTDANGVFGFPSVAPGMQTLDPTKQGDFRAAVTALDASFVLEYVSGMRDFDDDQLLAADVTADGTVSALDATRILQFQAGIVPRFGVALACFSDWVFRPSPVMLPNQTLVEPEIGDLMCIRGAIEYGSPFMPPAAGQNFTAILFGDTTGNWGATP